jgi:biopolymer transport protein ExbD
MARKSTEELGLNMTPMIDVVFQLMIYFLVTLKPVDVSAHLDVFRPAAPPPSTKQDPPPNLLRIEIFAGNTVLLNGRSMTMANLGDMLDRFAAANNKQTVFIMCARDSKHDTLIQVLDRCAKAGLNSLGVASMNE